jgi:cobalt-zinc-cadmium efflux system outer membrane protein
MRVLPYFIAVCLLFAVSASAEDEFTLTRVLRLAERDDERLAALRADLAAARARAGQEALPLNPQLRVEMENFAGSGSFSGTSSLETTVLLDVPLELAGQRSGRAKVAEAAVSLAEAEYELKRRELLRDVEAAFFGVLAAQAKGILAAERLRRARERHESILAARGTGRRGGVDARQADVVLATLATDLALAESELRTSRAVLAGSWAAGERVAIGEVIGDLDALEVPSTLPVLLGKERSSIQARSWTARVRLMQESEARAHADGIPTPTLGLGYRRFEQHEGDAMVAGLSLPLPLFNRNQGEIEAARLEVEEAKRRERASAFTWRASLREVHGRLLEKFGEATSLRDSVLPEAREALRVMEEGDERGVADYAALQHADSVLYALETRYIDSLRQYHGARIDLEALLSER